MADVRLTATNPADSSVVPVACNERGELKLEEIPDQSFDGNLDGDLTVSGSVSFTGEATLTTNIRLNTGGVRSNASSVIDVYDQEGRGVNDPAVTVKADGSARFAGQVSCESNSSVPLVVTRTLVGGECFRIREPDGNPGVVQMYNNGSASFAGNKAGFTAEGYLWCTTRRGDTVILDFTSNGTAQWAPYTPPNRFTEIQDRWSEKDGILPVPHESSQDEPETPQ